MPIAIADIVILAVIILAVVLGAKSGLVKSLAGVIVLVCSALGATFAAKVLADPLTEKLAPMLSEGLAEKIRGMGQSGSAVTASAEEMLQRFGFSGQTLKNLAEKAIQSAAESGQALADSVVNTVTHSIAYAAVFLVAFLILLIVLSLIVKALELATELPGLKTLNTVGGAALGLIKGLLLVFCAVWVLRRLQLVITPEMVEHSVVLSFFANFSPLSLLTGL